MNLFKYTTPAESTGFLVWKVSNRWQQEIRKSLKKHHLTHTQFVILASAVWLSKSRTSVTQIEIANQLEIDKMMTSNILRTLEKKGFLIRSVHQKDTRAKTVTPTKKGINCFKKAVEAVEACDDLFFGRLNNNATFNKELIKLLAE